MNKNKITRKLLYVKTQHIKKKTIINYVKIAIDQNDIAWFNNPMTIKWLKYFNIPNHYITKGA